MVDVAVREDHSIDAAAAQQRVDLAAERRQARVHDRYAVAVLDEVEVHDVVAEAVEAGRDFGHAVTLRVRIPLDEPGLMGYGWRPMASSRLYLPLKSMP